MDSSKLSRRDFLKLAGVAGAAIGVGSGLGGLLAACGGEETTTTTAATTATTAGATTTTAGAATTTTAATTATTAGATTTVSAAAAPLKVGMILDYSFPLHVAWQHEMEALIPAINQKGGVTIGGTPYQVALTMYDGKRDSETSRSAVQRLLSEDKVDFILGDESTDYWQPVTEAAGKVVCSVSPSSEILKPPNKFTFQAGYLNLQPAAAWGYFSEQNPEVKKVASAHPDNLQGNSEAGKTKNLATIWGQEVVKEVLYPQGTTDFSAIATALVNTGADVFTTCAGGTVSDAQLYKALHQAGWKGKLCAYIAWSIGSGSAVVSPDNFEGITSPIQGTDLPGTKSPVAQELIDTYTAKNGKWDYPTNLHVSSWYLLRTALEKAGTIDAQKVADTIHAGLEYEAAYGKAKMVPRPDLGNSLVCDALWAITVGKVVGGQYTILKEMTFDEAYAYNKKALKWA
jgi:branched-chain amino acid transport system substrate-binding protein